MLMMATTAAMIEQFNQNNILILEEMGYEVHVLGNFLEGNPISGERLEAFKKWIEAHHGKWFHYTATRKPTDVINNTKAYQYTVRLIEKYHYRFIHCHSPIGSVIARAAAHKTHTMVIYTAHGFHFFKGAPLRNWLCYYPVEYLLSKWTDILILINKEDYNRARKNFHALQTVYIPGVGVDLNKFGNKNRARIREKFHIPENAVLLLSVGELNDNKNHEAAIRAVAEIIRERKIKKEVYYIIAGQGHRKEKLTELVHALSLTDKIFIPGFCEDISELYAAADIFVFPSHREGLSVALMEAMAGGLVVACGRIRGNTELIDENGGVFFEPDDISSIRQALTELLLTDEEALLKKGAYNLVKIREYSSERVDQISRAIYQYGGGKKIAECIERLRIREKLGCGNKEIIVLSVGELNKNKNHEAVIRAMPLMENQNIRYFIAGKGRLKNDLQKLARKLGLEHRVHFMGFQKKIAEIYQCADIFVFPSKREGLGLAALEAMASGLPLLTSNHHGIRDYSVDGETGYIFETESELADKMTLLAEDAVQRTAMGLHNRTAVIGYGLAGVHERMKNIYENLEKTNGKNR